MINSLVIINSKVFGISLAFFRAWMDPTSKKEEHWEITAHTVLLYVLFCITYCTYYTLDLTRLLE